MGTLPPLNLTQNPSLPVVTFYLAKIVNGSPRVLRVTIDIDWRNRFFQQPKVEVIFPNTNPREPKRLFMAWNSISECGIDRVVFKEMPTSTQDLYRSIYPKQINALLTDQALKSKDLIRLNRILVSLEISDNPGRYEYPILIYHLPRHRRAKLYKFEN